MRSISQYSVKRQFLLITFLGVLLFGIGEFLIWEFVVSEIKQDKARELVNIKENIQEQLDLIGNVVLDLRAYYYASGEIDPDAFQIVIDDAIERYPEIKSGYYVERVLAKQRAQFEHEMSRRGYLNFKIKDKVNQKYIYAGDKRVYYPVVLLDPLMPETANKLGWDLGGRPQLLAALQKSEASRNLIRTFNGQLKDFWLFQSIFRGQFSTQDLSQLKGLFALEVDFIKLVEKLNTDKIFHFSTSDSPPDLPGSVSWVLEKINLDKGLDNQGMSIFLFSSVQLSELPISYMIIVSTIYFVFLVVLFYFIYAEENNKRLLAQAQQREKEMIQKKNLELESRVQIRTKEVTIEKYRAEKASRAKTAFLASMSHELKTPLNAIIGFAQMLEMDKAQFDENQRDYIKQISKAGHYLLTMVRQVLELSQLERGNLPVACSHVDLVKAAQDAIDLLRPVQEQYQVTLAFEHPKALPQVIADNNRLIQVMINLLSNAFKYNRPGGTVEVKIYALDMDYIRVDVEDSGIGMKPHEVDKVFEMFARFATNRVSVDGIGVGLSIVKYLVEQMGGEVGLESEFEKGSKFWIKLRIA